MVPPVILSKTSAPTKYEQAYKTSMVFLFFSAKIIRYKKYPKAMKKYILDRLSLKNISIPITICSAIALI